jgi:multisubunit Na+/H+ antiporter MnhC subunit
MMYFCGMANEHHHHEPEQNEIAGPVVFALILFAIVVTAIGFMAS